MTTGMISAAPEFAAWILGSLSSGIVGVDAQGAVVMINEGARRILGCPAGELADALGEDCRAVLAAQPTVARLLLETLDGGAALSRAELVLDGPNGTASTIGFTLSPVRDGTERLRGATIIFRDLTPFERSDEQERLRDRLAALGQMAAGLAHEIRNPLAGMEVAAGLLKRRLADRPDECELVNELTGQLRQLAGTVTSSLEFVRPVSLAHEPVDPIALVEDSLALAATRVGLRGSIERRYESHLPDVVVDRELIGAAITNLIENALEAMLAGDERRTPRLTLEVACRVAQRPAKSVRVGEDEMPAQNECGSTRELEIAICDTGPGIPEELREKVFYPFFTTKECGSGIGLANVQKIVAGHGGSLALESRIGEGSTFRLRLPLDETDS